MNIFDSMLKHTEKIWQSYLDHPFIQAVIRGDLSHEQLKHHIIQGHLYLKEYSKAFGIGYAKASSDRIRKVFLTYMNNIHEYELEFLRTQMKNENISEEEVSRSHQSFDSISYTSYLLKTAYEQGEAEILSAVSCCAYSYEYIADYVLSRNPDLVNHKMLGNWISGYVTDTYREGNQMLKDALIHLADGLTRPQCEHLLDIFEICSKYELKFWDLAWEMK